VKLLKSFKTEYFTSLVDTVGLEKTYQKVLADNINSLGISDLTKISFDEIQKSMDLITERTTKIKIVKDIFERLYSSSSVNVNILDSAQQKFVKGNKEKLGH